MVTFTINIPPMLAYIPYMDPMGIGSCIKPALWGRMGRKWAANALESGCARSWKKFQYVPIIVGGLSPEFFTSLEMAMLNSFVAQFTVAHCCRICWKPFELRMLGGSCKCHVLLKNPGLVPPLFDPGATKNLWWNAQLGFWLVIWNRMSCL